MCIFSCSWGRQCLTAQRADPSCRMPSTGTSVGGLWQYLARYLTCLTLRYLLVNNVSVIGTGGTLDPADVKSGLLIASLNVGTLKVMKATIAGGMYTLSPCRVRNVSVFLLRPIIPLGCTRNIGDDGCLKIVRIF